MMSETWEITAMHILTNISRSNGNKTMKFGQLIEYDMRNIKVIIIYFRFHFTLTFNNFYKMHSQLTSTNFF